MKKGKAPSDGDGLNLGSLPGQGIVTEYRSEAAEWLQKREYKGLEDTEVEVKEAQMGWKGVASGYS